MTRFTTQLISMAGLMLCAFTAPAFSSTVVNGGIIHFRGAIVEPPCDIASQKGRLALSCPGNDKVQTTMVSYADALGSQRVNSGLTTVSMKYINPQKTLATVLVEYR